MAQTFDYAIRKDVKNKPVFREVDKARYRELWRSAAMVGVFVILLLAWAWPQFKLRQYGYEIAKAEADQKAEAARTQKLQLEIRKLTAPQRIEEVATKQLHLVEPSKEEAIVIERTVPTQPPSQSVVARR
jgi:cell division protein FtsL